MELIPAIGALLIVIGAWGMLTQQNMMKMVIGFSIIDTGAHLMIVSIGYVIGGTAPIIDADARALGASVEAATSAGGAVPFVDPVPAALVLTAIVIGLAVTALMLSYVVRLARTNGSLDVGSYKELKW